MRIFTCAYGSFSPYIEQFKVFKHSILKNTQDELWVFAESHIKDLGEESDRFRIVRIEELPTQETFVQKLMVQATSMQYAAPGEVVCLCDSDCIVLKPVNPGIDGFDVAYTSRDASHSYPINAGVIYARSSLAVSQWFRKTVDECMFNVTRGDEEKFGSTDQAALCKMLEINNTGSADLGLRTLKDGIRALGLSCREFNLVDDWSHVPENCRIVHFKSGWRELLKWDSIDKACDMQGWDARRRKNLKRWQECFDLWKSYQGEVNESQ